MNGQSRKTAIPFHSLDFDEGWEQLLGGPPGLELKQLSDAFDERGKTGVRTRLIRFRPGTVTTGIAMHDYWEEACLIEGALTVDCGPTGAGGTTFTAPGYVCRPPGTPHGPFASPGGCVLLETHYYLGCAGTK